MQGPPSGDLPSTPESGPAAGAAATAKLDKDAAEAILAAPRAPREPVTAGEVRATAVLFGIFIVNILLAVLFAAPFHKAGLQAFQNPEDSTNALWYLLLILVFTFVILWIAKKGKKNLIRGIILFAVGSTIAYVVYPLVALLTPDGSIVPYVGLQTVPLAAALALSIASVVLLFKHPEWWVIDSVGLLVASGSAAIFGISFGILPVLLLLAMLAIYDAIAVYRTKHMLALADTVIDLRLPVLLVIPKHAGYHFKAEAGKFKEASAENKGEREAMFMGLGDLVMPTMLVVSALMFMAGATALPLVHTLTPDEAAGLPVDVTVDMAGSGSQAIGVRYMINSTAAGSQSWNWSVDLDLDGHADAQGHGLPGYTYKEYDQPAIVVVNASVDNGAGATGYRVAVANVDYRDSGIFLAVNQLVHNPPALGAALGTLAGFLALMVFVLRGNPQAGLPLLNGGAIAGFLIGVYNATGSLTLW